MKKLLIVSGLISVLFFGVAYVYAHGPGDPGHRGPHWQESWGPGKDNPLTPEQKTKFQELRRKFRAENAQLIGSIVAKRLELQSLWTDPKADPKAIEDKSKELRNLQDQMKDKMVQMRLEARKLLTPEQIANWKPGWGMGRGPHGPMMGGRRGMMSPGQGMGMGMGRGGGMCD